MKTKNLFSLPARMKLIFIIPALLLAITVISACSASKRAKTAPSEVALPPPPPPPPSSENQKIVEEANDMEVPFVVVEQMPMYPGGDSELLKYIDMNTKYPETAKNNGIQGKVIVRFCVTSRGGVSQISVLKGVSPELDEEAVRVVKTLPSFVPGKQGGKPVPVWYMVPIRFTLR